jgi:hypothetical protein
LGTRTPNRRRIAARAWPIALGLALVIGAFTAAYFAAATHTSNTTRKVAAVTRSPVPFTPAQSIAIASPGAAPSLPSRSGAHVVHAVHGKPNPPSSSGGQGGSPATTTPTRTNAGSNPKRPAVTVPGTKLHVVVHPHAAKLHPLGGVDLTGYCRSIGYADGAELDGQRLAPYAAYHWHCRKGNQTSPLSVIAACQSQYAAKGVTARAQNINDAFSWRCYTSS